MSIDRDFTRVDEGVDRLNDNELNNWYWAVDTITPLARAIIVALCIIGFIFGFQELNKIM